MVEDLDKFTWEIHDELEKKLFNILININCYAFMNISYEFTNSFNAFSLFLIDLGTV